MFPVAHPSVQTLSYTRRLRPVVIRYAHKIWGGRFVLVPVVLITLFRLFESMADQREDSVYLAKLAEQAERYEGKLIIV